MTNTEKTDLPSHWVMKWLLVCLACAIWASCSDSGSASTTEPNNKQESDPHDNHNNHNSDASAYELIGVATDGSIANNNCSEPSLSDDGTLVAFSSVASNLHPNTDGAIVQVYLRDRTQKTTTLISRAVSGQPGNNNSATPMISGNGRYIVFASYASDLVENDTNGKWDIFVYDRQNETLVRASLDALGQQVNGDSENPSIADNGRLIAFESTANNLVENDTNKRKDVFVRDLETSEVTRVSVTSQGNQSAYESLNPAISDDGHLVAFDAYGDDLVANDSSATGRTDVFLHDRETGETRRVSILQDENQMWAENPSLSEDGRYVGFRTRATFAPEDVNQGRVDAYRWDANSATFVLASRNFQGQSVEDGDSGLVSLDDSGDRIVFESDSDTVTADDTNKNEDLFLYQASTQTVTRLTSLTPETQLDQPIFSLAISGNGKTVAFSTASTNLIANSGSLNLNIFAKDVQ